MKSTTATDEKAPSTKQSTAISSNATQQPAAVTKAPSRNGQQYTVVFHTPAKERFDDKLKIESKVLSILSKALKEHDRKLGKIPKGDHTMEALSEGSSSTISPTLESTTDEVKGGTDVHPTSVERVAEFALRKALKEKGQDDEPQLAAPNKLYSLTSSSVESIEDSLPNAPKSGINFAKANVSSRQSGNNATTALSESAEEASEVNEVLALIEADEKAEKAEASSDTSEIKRLREETRAKIMAFLQKRGCLFPEATSKNTSPATTTSTTPKETSTSSYNFKARTIPIYQALKPPPLSQPNYAQSYPQVATLPLVQQASKETLTISKQAQANAAHPALPPFFVAPPPGYVGPLPPPPPPPPLPPSRYPIETPRRAPSSKLSSANGLDTTPSTTPSHPVYYPVETDKQSAFTIESSPTELPKPSPVAVPVQRGK
ncbi:hypothetical protein TELCIR_00495 [Teladorsagia circumcincta]|uniref:Uncharacterized protein n=1 Tax=Teladorsagia circumcincta TaxID=45464 RepID=A0A2G9V4P2_TELCI|nr:hypothetical protein TELCIR_00495 [Teladorsagia circumcincta]